MFRRFKSVRGSALLVTNELSPKRPQRTEGGPFEPAVEPSQKKKIKKKRHRKRGQRNHSPSPPACSALAGGVEIEKSELKPKDSPLISH